MPRFNNLSGRINQVGGPQERAGVPGLATARAVGEVAKQVEDLGFTIAEKTKRMKDADYAFDSKMQLLNDSEDNFKKLKEQYPTGEGLAEAQKEFLRQRFDQIQKNAPSETAKRMFVDNSISMVLDKNKESELYATRTQIDHSINNENIAIQEQSKRMLDAPSLQGATEAYNITIQKANAKRGFHTDQRTNKLIDDAREINYQAGQGLLNRAEQAKNIEETRRILGQLRYGLRERTGKSRPGSLEGTLSRGLHADEKQRLLDMADRVERAKEENHSFKITNRFNDLMSKFDNNVNPGEVSGEMNSLEQDIKSSKWSDDDKASKIVMMRIAKARSGIFEMGSKNGKAEDLEGKYQEFIDSTDKIIKETGKEFGLSGSRMETFGETAKSAFKSESVKYISKIREMINKKAPEFFLSTDRNLQNAKAQMITTDQSGLATVNPAAFREFVYGMQIKKQESGSQDPNILDEESLSRLGTVIKNNPEAAAGIAKSINIALADRPGIKSRVYKQLMEDEKIPPELALAGMWPSERGSAIIMANSSRTKAEKERISASLSDRGTSRKNILARIERNDEVKKRLNAIQDTAALGGANAISSAVSSAIADQAELEVLSGKNESNAVDAAVEKLQISSMNVFSLSGDNGLSSNVFHMQSLAESEKISIEKTMEAALEPAVIDSYDIPPTAEFIAQIQKDVTKETSVNTEINAEISKEEARIKKLRDEGKTVLPADLNRIESLKRRIVKKDLKEEVAKRWNIKLSNIGKLISSDDGNDMIFAIEADGMISPMRDSRGELVKIPIDEAKNIESLSNPKLRQEARYKLTPSKRNKEAQVKEARKFKKTGPQTGSFR